MGKILVWGGALVLALVACGGSDDSSSDTADTASSTPAPSTPAPSTEGGSDATTPTPDSAAAPPDADDDGGDAGDDDGGGDDGGGDDGGGDDGGGDDGGGDDGGGDDGGGDAAGSGPSTATATINGETYEFSTEGALVAQCQTDLFGVFSVQLPMVGGDGGIQVIALLEGTDPAVVEQVDAVRISIGDEDWLADEASDIFDASDALQPGMSQVDSVEIDGSTVRGSATFVRQLSVFGAGDVETATGTFEATCGEERLS